MPLLGAGAAPAGRMRGAASARARAVPGPPEWRERKKAAARNTSGRPREGRYMRVGADTPISDRHRAITERTASHAARRARTSSGSTGWPSLGSTWQAA